jgi:hypothetical protein
MSRRAALGAVLMPPIVWRSAAIAAVVGTILNLINQGDAMLSGNGLVLWKLVLTYCVPFLVASYGGYSALRTF